MSAISTANSLCSGHDSFPPRPVAESVPWFTVNGVAVLADGATFPEHTDGDTSHPGNAVSTRPWFSIGGKGVVCEGDPLSCGSVVASGDNTLEIG